MSRKQKRIFRPDIRRVQMQGILMTLPDEAGEVSEQEEKDSVAVLICPVCHAERYVTQAFLDVMQEMAGIHEAIEQALPRHQTCNAIMRIEKL